MVYTKADLEIAALRGCQIPGCSHDNHDATLFLHGRRHPGARVDVSYTAGSGVLLVSCAKCHKLIVEILVAE